MTTKNIFLTIILLTLFTGTSMLALVTAKKITTPFSPHSPKNPDFYMTEAIYIKFDHQGRVQNKVQSSKITHFTLHNVYLFTHPNMTIYVPQEQPWYVTANQGKSENGKAKIDMWDKVTITRQASINNLDFDIATNALTVYPDIKFAETAQPITIIQSGNVTKAVGAKADFTTGIIKLISKVQAWYQLK